NDTLFLSSGTLLEGGQQDRVVINDRVILPHSFGQILPVYCVEHDRSFKRRDEALERFHDANQFAAPEELRLFLLHPLLLTPPQTLTVGTSTGSETRTIALDPQLLKMLGSNPSEDPIQEAIWSKIQVWQSELIHSIG